MPDVRRATSADLDTIARIHQRAYSASHFTSLLPRQTLMAYYGLFLGNGADITLLIDDPRADTEHVLGFAVFGRDIERRIAQFKRENRRAILSTSLRHPLRAAGKVLEQLGSQFKKAESFSPAPYLLLSIAVTEQGQGAGGHLLGAMIGRAIADGAAAIGLYVQQDNAGAVAAYEKHGFAVTASIARQYYMERAVP